MATRKTTSAHNRGGAWRVFKRTGSTVASPHLPFEMPVRSTLIASPKKVWGHYFTSFLTSIDNLPVTDANEYIKKWLPPGSTSVGGINRNATGGFFRARPFSTATRPRLNDADGGHRNGSQAWEFEDRKDQVTAARNAGLDGFTVDMLNLSTQTTGERHFQQFQQLFDAVDAVAGSPGDFHLVAMPDGNAGQPGLDTNANQLADDLALVAAEPNAYKVDGKFLYAPYGPEFVHDSTGANETAARSKTFWTAVNDRLRITHGIDSWQWNCHSRSWLNSATDPFAGAPMYDTLAFIYGHGRWGDRDPNAMNGSGTSNRGAPAHCRATFTKKKWMHFTAPQDLRYHDGSWWEAWNTEALRAGFMAGIDGEADAIQIPTWNDYSESTNIEPTDNHKFALLDLCSYYTVWYKTGAPPPIVRDCVYLSHRIMHTTTPTGNFTGGQTLFMNAVSGSTTAKNEVEALCFLTESATVKFTVCGTVTTINNVPAGLSSQKVPLPSGVAGTVRVEVSRSGTTFINLLSPYDVVTTALSQDFDYRYMSSLRGA